jgi:hypothetical protein
MKFIEWLDSLAPPRDYKHSTGADIADSIALVIICALLLFVVFI